MSNSQNASDRRDVIDGDRRIIDRFSDPRIYGHFKQISLFIKILAAFLTLGAVYSIYEALFIHNSVGLGIFKFCVCTFGATLLFKFNQDLKNFLANESINNLTIVIERQMTLWLLTTMTVVISFIWSIL